MKFFRMIFPVVVLLVFAVTGLSLAMNHGNDAVGCAYCGMGLERFAHSKMSIKYDDASDVHVCSIHCAAIDLALNIDKTPSAIMVADYASGGMTDAEKATWVIGGSKPGVMSKRAKWAFSKEEDARSFAESNGGRVASFDEAMAAAYSDMYYDTMMIREKRKKMKSMGTKH